MYLIFQIYVLYCNNNNMFAVRIAVNLFCYFIIQLDYDVVWYKLAVTLMGHACVIM